MAERITLHTVDGVDIVGEWVTSPTTIGAAIVLHMYTATRHSWTDFQRALASRGIASLAIDLRGHGESLKGPAGSQLDYNKFNNEENASTIHDIRAAFEWIRTRGIERDRIALVGASIGANLAIQFLGEEPLIPAAVLLSPGVDYHGIKTLDALDNVLPHQAVSIFASEGDDDESVKASEVILEGLGIQTKSLRKLKQAGHGTKIFESQKELMNEVADWLRERLLSS